MKICMNCRYNTTFWKDKPIEIMKICHKCYREDNHNLRMECVDDFYCDSNDIHYKRMNGMYEPIECRTCKYIKTTNCPTDEKGRSCKIYSNEDKPLKWEPILETDDRCPYMGKILPKGKCLCTLDDTEYVIKAHLTGENRNCDDASHIHCPYYSKIIKKKSKAISKTSNTNTIIKAEDQIYVCGECHYTSEWAFEYCPKCGEPKELPTTVDEKLAKADTDIVAQEMAKAKYIQTVRKQYFKKEHWWSRVERFKYFHLSLNYTQNTHEREILYYPKTKQFIHDTVSYCSDYCNYPTIKAEDVIKIIHELAEKL